MNLTFLYLGILILVASIGIVLWRKINNANIRIIVTLTVYCAIVEFSVINYAKWFTIGNNKYPQYNLIVLIEFLVYAYFFYSISASKRNKQYLLFFLYVFPILWYLLTFGVFKINSWNSVGFLIGGFCTIIWCVMYYVQLLKQPEVPAVNRNSEFWVVTGIAVFYVTVIPFMGMYNFLGNNVVWLAQSLKPVLQFSNIVMYSLFAYAFICQSQQTHIRK